ncbi:MAG: PilZ domain-containing protein [Nitrospira sp.]|nr:PilZ domain-containing protein [Nitrospira sp.]
MLSDGGRNFPKRGAMAQENWEAWEIQREKGHQHQRDRFPLMRPVQYQTSVPIGEQQAITGQSKGLSVNVSSGGMCLLIDHAPELQSVMRVHVPMLEMKAQTPTLAEVRWVRRLPFNRDGLYYVGLKFLL